MIPSCTVSKRVFYIHIKANSTKDCIYRNVPELAKSPAPKRIFGAGDRFHVDMIAQVWVPVMDYYETISNVKETLFNTLKEHGMSNMSVDSRVRLIKNIVETENPDDKRKKK